MTTYLHPPRLAEIQQSGTPLHSYHLELVVEHVITREAPITHVTTRSPSFDSETGEKAPPAKKRRISGGPVGNAKYYQLILPSFWRSRFPPRQRRFWSYVISFSVPGPQRRYVTPPNLLFMIRTTNFFLRMESMRWECNWPSWLALRPSWQDVDQLL